MQKSAPELTAELNSDLAALGFPDAALEGMPGTGVSHNHYAIGDSKWIIRAPHLSQSGMNAADQLAIQAAAFERAALSSAAPKLLSVLPLSPHLPRGGLVVEKIGGRLPTGAADLPAIAWALAAIHSLPVPPPTERAPIPYHPQPLAPLAATVKATLEAYLSSAGLTAKANAVIEKRLRWLTETARHNPFQTQARLCVSDTHPGNFRIQDSGEAIFVDLEKPAYSCPAIDLAHAVIRVSANWDPVAGFSPSRADRQTFVDAWLNAVPDDVAAIAKPAIVPIRQAVWLRTISFFMKWRKESSLQGPWSSKRLGPAAAAHFRAHVDASLSEDAIISAADDWE